jgi:hypothetical protein
MGGLKGLATVQFGEKMGGRNCLQNSIPVCGEKLSKAAISSLQKNVLMEGKANH